MAVFYVRYLSLFSISCLSVCLAIGGCENVSTDDGLAGHESSSEVQVAAVEYMVALSKGTQFGCYNGDVDAATGTLSYVALPPQAVRFTSAGSVDERGLFVQISQALGQTQAIDMSWQLTDTSPPTDLILERQLRAWFASASNQGQHTFHSRPVAYQAASTRARERACVEVRNMGRDDLHKLVNAWLASVGKYCAQLNNPVGSWRPFLYTGDVDASFFTLDGLRSAHLNEIRASTLISANFRSSDPCSNVEGYQAPPDTIFYGCVAQPDYPAAD